MKIVPNLILLNVYALFVFKYCLLLMYFCSKIFVMSEDLVYVNKCAQYIHVVHIFVNDTP